MTDKDFEDINAKFPKFDNDKEAKEYHLKHIADLCEKSATKELAELKQRLINDNIINGNGEAKEEIHLDKKQDHFEIIVKTVKKTVMCEDSLIRQIICTGISSKTDDPINLAIIAPTSEGKTYPITESVQFFPDKDVMYIGGMTTKVLVRQNGVLVDSDTGEPIAKKILELKIKIKSLSDKDPQKEELKALLNDVYANSKTVIDLTGKILIFFEPPQFDLWNLLKPILSHDKKEISYDYVDTSQGIHTKKIIVRGWPSCIFCSAKDESHWTIWPEIQSRFLITSPNMIPRKYYESNILIAQKKGLPNSIQENVIVSKQEIQLAKECMYSILENIEQLKSENPDGRISIWIPYLELVAKVIPSGKGTDVRIFKRISSLLNVIPIIKSHLRHKLKCGEEKSIIASLDDLKQVLSITQNFDGIPKYKLDFFNDVFYPCYETKTEPDTNGTKTENIIGVTSRELCNFYKSVYHKTINSDQVKKTYLNELYQSGIIDQEKSVLNGSANIYYPVMEPRKDDSNSNDLASLTSKSSHFDDILQQSRLRVPKNYKQTDENWLILQILTLLYHRVGQDRYRGPLGDLLNSELEFLDIDGNRMSVSDFCQQYDGIPTSTASMLFEGSNFKYLQENDNGNENMI